MRSSSNTILLGVFVAAFFSGCASNIGAVKSEDGKDVVPMVGSAAKNGATSLAVAKGGPAAGKLDDRLEAVALFPGPEQPVGIAISQSGRMFLSFPRWADPVKYTVVELKAGRFTPFPDAETNRFDGNDLTSTPPSAHLISAQAIVFDERDRLWVLDPGAVNFGVNIVKGPKLWCYDINTRQRVKTITFPTDVAMKMTGLNDVRFDLKRGAEGTAYISDSGVGGIIVVDIASGQSWRHLDKHPSVLATPGLKQQSEGQPFMIRKASGEVDGPDLRSDGIALSPDGKTLYYTVVAGRDVWAISTDLLADRDPNHEQQIQAGVQKVATKSSGTDGIACDSRGRIYTTDFEDGAIRRVDPATGTIETVVQDERLLWPDTLCLHGNDLYLTSNQLARQPNYHFGSDQRKPPYALFRIPVNASPRDVTDAR